MMEIDPTRAPHSIGTAVPSSIEQEGFHSPLFEGLASSAVTEILAAARRVTKQEGELIISEGGKCHHIYLIKVGDVRYYRLTDDGREIVLGWIGSGDSFGMAGLLEHPRPYIGSAQAMSACELWAWDTFTIRRLARISPRLSENALSIVLRYLERGIEKHVGVLHESAAHRLADALFHMAQRNGRPSHDGVEVRITNEQLGDLAAVSPFTASRVLHRLQHDGTLSKSRERVVIHSLASLAFHNGQSFSGKSTASGHAKVR